MKLIFSDGIGIFCQKVQFYLQNLPISERNEYFENYFKRNLPIIDYSYITCFNSVKIFRIFRARESLKIIRARRWSDLRELQGIKKHDFFNTSQSNFDFSKENNNQKCLS